MKIGTVLKLFLLVWMLAVIWGAFYYAQAAEGFIGQSSRIVFFHVPTAWVCVIAFLVSCVFSVRYLITRNADDDIRAAVSARLGLIFAVLATVTGAIFARIMWNAYWNWDPRQTSIFILLLIYFAYFALRSAVPDPERRASLSAVYAILAFVTVPFLIFIVPRIYWSLHPDVMMNTDEGGGLDAPHRIVLFSSAFGFVGFFAWLYSIESRVERIRLRRRQEVL
jgi:heme exporter protein C